MSSKFTALAIDCHDARRLAEFWSAVLGYEVLEEDEEGVSIGVIDRERSGPVPPTLDFLRVPESKTVKNRLHIDVNPADRDQDDEVRRVIELGARQVDIGQGDQTWVVLADPEGNEFCILRGRRP